VTPASGSASGDATDFRRRVVAVISGLQPGEVVSYGDVAAEAGFPGAARAVGAVLASDAADDLPWWRVVTAAGRLVPGHEARHARMLRKEGVAVVDGRVRVARHGRGPTP
jgi:methylated-DNA-protein-cysteine methyltransferase-like protein